MVPSLNKYTLRSLTLSKVSMLVALVEKSSQ